MGPLKVTPTKGLLSGGKVIPWVRRVSVQKPARSPKVTSAAQKWTDVLATGGGQKKRFQHCLKPDEPERLLYLRSIQGHSGRAHSGNALVDLVLQDNVLLPMIFNKYVYHVGHGNEVRSIVHNGLIPGGFSKQADVLCSSPCWIRWMDQRGLRETFCDLSQARIAPEKIL